MHILIRFGLILGLVVGCFTQTAFAQMDEVVVTATRRAVGSDTPGIFLEKKRRFLASRSSD